LAPGAGLVYGSGFEGRTALLERLMPGRPVYGNAPATIALVRDPARFFPLLQRLGIRHPAVRLTPPSRSGGWLLKGRGSAGGTRVQPASGRPASPAHYYQRLVPGDSRSVTFLADGRRARVLGFNRQWTAPRRGRPYLYGGAVGGLRPGARLRREIEEALDSLVLRTGLVGLNGLDFILHDGRWLALELNPRPTATFELYDADYSAGLFHWHLRACRGELPARAAVPRAVRAQAIVHAPVSGGARGMRFPRWCRDLPMAATRFAPGDPVCSVHASAATVSAALTLIRRRTRTLERALAR
jgi:predicted ATP-grasp superfamily ATP-dependent carboligase